MRDVTHIVMHTAAATVAGVPLDCSAAQIDQWHKNQGWSKIGYHYVVRFDGRVEKGRQESEVGAGVFGFNSKSIHICFSGHGDVEPPTLQQWDAAVKLVAEIVKRRGLRGSVLKNPSRILGHREAWYLRLVPKPIRKSCPGWKTDMKAFRRDVLETLAR